MHPMILEEAKNGMANIIFLEVTGESNFIC